ncbi:septum site-determining protein MinC, partial [Klebsiella pneumoniae]|uniref:septum site-determining protein MinC n=1 Tax=Klebsiella pneumoniae TaxID=573 RepID=UPI0038BC50B3
QLEEVKATKEQVVEVKPEPTAVSDDQAPAAPIVAHITSYPDEILRTGQCIVQHNGDIIINAGINSGSEVIASGNIHVY